MTSVKWSTISFFGLGALVTASMAFVGCSVTSGTITDDGGPGTINNPEPDSSTGTDSATAVCSNNTKEQAGLFAEACQAALNNQCCNEMINLFGFTPTDTTKPSNGNALIACIERCNFKTDGTTTCTSDADCTTPEGSACLTEIDNTKKCHAPETDDSLYKACKGDCQALAQPDVTQFEDSLEVCIKEDPTAALECGELIR